MKILYMVERKFEEKTEPSVDNMVQLELPFMSAGIFRTVENEKLDYNAIKNMTSEINAAMDKIAERELLVDKAIKKIIDKSS